MENNSCSSLYEAILTTCNKYGYGEDKYLEILTNLVNGNFRVITSDNGCRNYLESNLYIEIDALYEHIVFGNAIPLTQAISINQKIYAIAEYFLSIKNKKEERNFGVLSKNLDNLLSTYNETDKKIILSNVINNQDGADVFPHSSAEIKLLVVENAYRLSIITQNKMFLGLFTDESRVYSPEVQSKRIEFYNVYKNYLRECFVGLDADNIIYFIKRIDYEQMNSMIDLYILSRRNISNIHVISSADTLDPNTIDIFKLFRNQDLVKEIESSSIKY